MSKFISNCIITCLFLAVLLGVGFGVHAVRAQEPEPTPAPVLVRTVFQEGQAGVAAWPVTQDGGSSQVTITPASGLPAGVSLQVVGNVARFSSDGTAEPGAYVTVMQVKISTPPPLEDWKGGMVESTHNLSVEFHILPAIADPFLSGPVDILASPVP